MEEKNLTYEAAMTELEAIVGSVEDGEMDIDHLSAQLRRAKELMAFCRDRLTKVDAEVQKIFGDETSAGGTEKTENDDISSN